MTGRGVKFVVNRNVALQRNGERLWLLGIDEVYRGEPDVAAAFAGVDENQPCIGVSHHPDIIDLLDGSAMTALLSLDFAASTSRPKAHRHSGSVA